jgi:hypothetical protein
MGLKGNRLWAMGQRDSTRSAPHHEVTRQAVLRRVAPDLRLVSVLQGVRPPPRSAAGRI